MNRFSIMLSDVDKEKKSFSNKIGRKEFMWFKQTKTKMKVA